MEKNKHLAEKIVRSIKTYTGVLGETIVAEKRDVNRVESILDNHIVSVNNKVDVDAVIEKVEEYSFPCENSGVWAVAVDKLRTILEEML